ncbi:phage holin family protein [Clostridium sp. AF22-10]
MAVLGVVLNIWINMSFTPEILLGGMFSGLSSTGLYEVFKQLIKK